MLPVHYLIIFWCLLYPILLLTSLFHWRIYQPIFANERCTGRLVFSTVPILSPTGSITLTVLSPASSRWPLRAPKPLARYPDYGNCFAQRHTLAPAAASLPTS